MGSDHHLLTAKVQVKLRSAGLPPKMTKRFNIRRMRDTNVRESFSVEVKNSFQNLPQESCDGIQIKWQSISQTYLKAAEDVIGFSKWGDKEWLSRETWLAVQERKIQKAKILECKSTRLKS